MQHNRTEQDRTDGQDV